MKFHRSSTICHGRGDVVFRNSLLAPVAGLIVTGGPALALASLAWQGRLPIAIAVVVCAFFACFVSVLGKSLRAAGGRGNWLLVVSQRQVWIKTRSFLVPEVGTERADVIELSRAEIRSARIVRIATRASQSEINTVDTYLDIELGADVDVDAVQTVLADARKRPFRAGLTWKHHPVSLTGRTLRLEWRTSSTRIAPSARRAVALFGPLAQPAVDQLVDFNSSDASGGAAALERLRALARQGQDLTAERIARRDLHWSEAEARRFLRNAVGRREPLPECP